jgi:hypothetical protein
VVADGPLTCFAMKRSDFERLLGPYEELWRYEALRKVSATLGHPHPLHTLHKAGAGRILWKN